MTLNFTLYLEQNPTTMRAFASGLNRIFWLGLSLWLWRGKNKVPPLSKIMVYRLFLWRLDVLCFQLKNPFISLSNNAPGVFNCLLEKQFNEGFSKRSGEEGIENWVDTGVSISKHMASNLKKRLARFNIDCSIWNIRNTQAFL